MKFDATRLSRLDWIVVGASALAFISLFLPWYGVSTTYFSASVSGWSTSYGWLGGLLIVASGIYLMLQRSQADLSRVKVGPATVVLGAAAVGTVIVILRWITLPRGSGGIGGVSLYSYGPRVGIWITLIVGVVEVVAAVQLFRSSGEKLPWATEATGTTGTAGTAGTAEGTEGQV
ncbi:MAG TPA: hypothetical protein VMD28_04455 [Acidimicrobiales bacterium]|nr:hypothetical protein [Acidimicrobiales bacterium]